MRSRFRTTLVGAAASALLLGSAGVAIASSVETAVVDVTPPTKAVTVQAGAAAAPITINATVTGNQEGTATFEVYRTWTLKGGSFVGSNPQKFTVAPRAAQDPVTTFSTSGSVSVDAAQAAGTFALAVPAFDITNSNDTKAKLAAGTAGSYAVTVVAAPRNLPPKVSVTGFTDGDTVELGQEAEPTPGCSVQDEDLNPTATMKVDRSGVDVHGLGDVTVTCSYTDSGNLTGSATATYTIIDTGNPTITGAVRPGQPDGAGYWYVSAPTVTFSCTDGTGSGIQSCVADGTDQASDSVTVGESAGPQTVTGTATDWAGNTGHASVSDLYVDLTDPTVSLVGGPVDGASYFFGDTPTAPTCKASDSASGVEGPCTVSGYDTSVGTHTVNASATDRAGRKGGATVTYTVKAWTLDGFYRPVDMGGVVNTVKAGSTVPLKFNVSKGSEKLTSDIGATFTAKRLGCDTREVTGPADFSTTGSTSLRYDTTSGQWIENWATPKAGAGSCYQVTMTTADGSQISADFRLK